MKNEIASDYPNLKINSDFFFILRIEPWALHIQGKEHALLLSYHSAHGDVEKHKTEQTAL